MSTSEDKTQEGVEREALKALEASVGTLLERLSELSERVRSAEAGRGQAEDLVKRMTGKKAGAADAHARVRDLEEENTELSRRLEEGRQIAESILAKIRFLEDQR